MSLKAFVAACQPQGFAARRKAFQALRIRGYSTGACLQCALRPSQARALRTSRLDLLPPIRFDSIKTIVDVGANVGDWSASLLPFTRPDHLILVEPTPTLHQQLVNRFSEAPFAKVFPLAVGEEIGKGRLLITAESVNCSLLAPRPEMNVIYGSGYDVLGSASVDVVTLDGLLEPFDEISLLKLDVQGLEAPALRGGRLVLKRTRYLLIECNYKSHYSGDSLFPELHALLVSSGMHLYNISEPVRLGGRALWADALYTRCAEATT